MDNSVERRNIELLSGKGQNGGAVEMEQEGSTKSSKASIKGMWKKAFRSLKTKDKTRSASESENGGSAISAASSPGEKPDTEKPQYKRMTSRQSSQKKGFFRRDSKESPREEAETPEEHGSTIDPVYSLLKCAADRSRSSVPPSSSQGGSKHAHACCSRASNQSNSDLGALSASGRSNNSRSSSPSSDYFEGTEEVCSSSICSCPCHTPEVLENYHAPILAAFKYYLPKIDKT